MGTFLLALAVAAASPCIVLLGTNDLHGHLTPKTITDARGTREVGGLSRLGAILRDLRARGEPVLLFDGGDLFQGTLESNLQHGRAVIAADNLLHYDAATLGNHEFDFGPELPGATPSDGDLQGAIKARLREAAFPFLAANLADARTGKLPDWPNLYASKLLGAGGVKVGVVGIVNPETPGLTVRRYVQGLLFEDPVPAIEREAKVLRDQGAQLVVLVAHLGGSCDPKNPDPKTSCERPSKLMNVLDALPAGTIDAAFGGHTHQLMSHWIDGIPVLEAGAEGRYYSELEACLSPTGGLDRTRTRIMPPHEITGPAQAKEIDDAIAPYLAAVAAEAHKPLGPVLRSALRRDYHALSPLGTMVAEAVRHEAHADVAVVNAGGLRADLPAGPLTFGALYEAFPFENRVVTLEVTGAQLSAFISALGGSGHGYPQVAGLSVSGHPGAYQLLDDAEKPIAPQRKYRLATLDFLLQGGDGTKSVTEGLRKAEVDPQAPKPLVRDAILAYLKSQ